VGSTEILERLGFFRGMSMPRPGKDTTELEMGSKVWMEEVERLTAAGGILAKRGSSINNRWSDSKVHDSFNGN
jgi:hypothetical protein